MWGRSRFAGWVLSGALGWLYFCSTAWFANLLMAGLESDYPARSVQNTPSAEAIVVLGGATRGETHGHRLADMNSRADRLLHAVALYKAGKAPLVLVSGGSLDWEAPEARLMADILVTMGVPSDAIFQERRSRNTWENARFSYELLAKREIESVLLVTSAFHMTRAEAAFRLQGIAVIPSATDYQLIMGPPVVSVWLPTVDDLHRSTTALREYVGAWVYGLRFS